MAAPDAWAECEARKHTRAVRRGGSRIRAAPEGFEATWQFSFESARDADEGAELVASAEGELWWCDFSPGLNSVAEEAYQQGRLVGGTSEYLWDFERMLQRNELGNVRRIRRRLREVSTTP